MRAKFFYRDAFPICIYIIFNLILQRDFLLSFFQKCVEMTQHLKETSPLLRIRWQSKALNVISNTGRMTVVS